MQYRKDTILLYIKNKKKRLNYLIFMRVVIQQALRKEISHHGVPP